ncbi:MAG: methyltransferase domain-containing protein [Planctomycetota bacterium]|nr:methyltransferase domain-containing protein [Planctomycetota bacterium]
MTASSAKIALESNITAAPLNVEEAVRDRYSAAAQNKEAALCCPVEYDWKYLAAIPDEIIERDYGCGDPSQFVNPGDTVLDLGSGGGKICYIAAQVAGSAGKVIGVDCNDDMLALARKYQPDMASKLGYANVEFRKGKIQDLKLNLELLDGLLADHPVQTSTDWLELETQSQRLRDTKPLIEADSIDVIVSNCVLNLVREDDRRQLFAEMFRTLRRGGRAVISDIVSDEDVPEALRNDARLWSGCMSGAYREDLFLKAFEDAGFYGIEIVKRQTEPWAVVDGIEFRSMTVRAWKGKEGPCLERKQAVVYNGPWKAVIDDDGHRLNRGERIAVCDKTFNIYTSEPYGSQITPLPPAGNIPLELAGSFDCRKTTIRDPRETKGSSPGLTMLPSADCCSPDGGCC